MRSKLDPIGVRPDRESLPPDERPPGPRRRLRRSAEAFREPEDRRHKSVLDRAASAGETFTACAGGRPVQIFYMALGVADLCPPVEGRAGAQPSERLKNRAPIAGHRGA